MDTRNKGILKAVSLAKKRAKRIRKSMGVFWKGRRVWKCRQFGKRIPDWKLEPKDMEGCHRLQVFRYSTDSKKRVIRKFVNRKHLTTGISGLSAKTYKEEGKFIKSSLTLLQQLKLPNAAVQENYIINMIYLILILIMYEKD